MFRIKGAESQLHSVISMCVYMCAHMRVCVHPSHFKKSHTVQLSFLCKNELLCLP